MLRRIIFLILAALLALTFMANDDWDGGTWGFKYHYEGWKEYTEVTPEESGHIKIPSEWEHEKIDGFIYFYIPTGEGEQYLLVQYTREGEENDYFADIVDREHRWSGGVTSGGAYMDEYNFIFNDGTEKVGYELKLTGFGMFIGFEEDISKETADMIVQSSS